MSSPALSSDEMSAKESAQGKSGKGPGMGKTLLTVVLGTWIGLAGAGGVLYFLAKSGKLPIGVHSAAQGTDRKATQAITLEPILANLADAGGHAYVRLGLRVELADAPIGADAGDESDAGKSEGKGEVPPGHKGDGGAAKTPNELESSVRDTVLAVLGRQSSADLLGPDGKEHLKIELKEAIERGAVRVEVKDLFFTDFLVQI